jgi:hypothetical protein
MHVHGLDVLPQWEVQGIGLPGTRAQSVRGQGAVTESQGCRCSFTQASFCYTHVLSVANFLGALLDPNKTVLA